MTKQSNKIELRYSVNSLCLLEKTLNKRTVDIIEEMEAEGGPAIHTLRAVLAAGLVYKDRMASLAMESNGMLGMPRLDVESAGALIESVGIGMASVEVGRSLGMFLSSLGGEA